MFRNRGNSQKPNDELLATFRATFPQVASTTRPSAPNIGAGPTLDALDVALHSRYGVFSCDALLHCSLLANNAPSAPRAQFRPPSQHVDLQTKSK
jgi:hypothetical protein